MTSHTTPVGEKIRHFREEEKMSQEELARQAGISQEQLTQIEENTDLPALSILLKIARALGTRLGTFLDDQDDLGPAVSNINSADVSFSTNSTRTPSHMHYHSLAHNKANRHMEPFSIEISPIEKDEHELSSHEGEEFIIVTEGCVEITYGNKNYVLNAGESIYYDSIVPHHVHAHGGRPAKILAVVYVPA